MSIVVIEGADGAGKSTLGKQLEAQAGFRYYASERPKSIYDMDRTMADIRSMYEDPGRIYLLDRAPWISDPIYARTFKRPMLLDGEEILKWVSKSDIRVLWCSPKGLKSDSIVRGKDYKPEAYMKQLIRNHKKLIDAYDQFFISPSHRFRWMRYDYQLPWAFEDAIAFAKGEI